MNQGYLSWGSNPYEPIVGFDWESKGVGKLYGAVLESGMDNLPLYDNAVYNEKTHLMEMADVARIIGRREEEKELRRRDLKFRQKLSSLWHEICLNL